MRSIQTFTRFAVGATIALAALNASAQAPTGEEKDRSLYAIGVLMAGQLAPLGLSAEELAHLERGLHDAALGGKPEVDPSKYREQINALQQERQSAVAAAEAEEAKKFVDQAAAQKGAIKTDSGLIYLEKVAGSGGSPVATDTVEVHYHGTLRTGKVFDSSVERGTPASFPLDRVIACWTEGLQRMKVGGKSRLVCPASVAYGDRGAPPNIPGGAAIAFEVELISINPKGQ